VPEHAPQYGRPLELSKRASIRPRRTADRAEAEDAEFGGTHGMEASGELAGRKREGRLLRTPPFVSTPIGASRLEIMALEQPASPEA